MKADISGNHVFRLPLCTPVWFNSRAKWHI